MASADALGNFNWENLSRKAILLALFAELGYQGRSPFLPSLENKYGQP
jgi:hypothetical protein